MHCKSIAAGVLAAVVLITGAAASATALEATQESKVAAQIVQVRQDNPGQFLAIRPAEQIRGQISRCRWLWRGYRHAVDDRTKRRKKLQWHRECSRLHRAGIRVK